MKNKTPFDFFKEYQSGMDSMDGMDLYLKLIKEEEDEFLEALKNKDIIEIYDAIADILWVKAGYLYFVTGGNVTWDYFLEQEENKFINLFNRDCILDCLNEVSRSNFTKSKQLQKDGEKIGKVIKGPSYSAPNLEPILKKYGIM